MAFLRSLRRLAALALIVGVGLTLLLVYVIPRVAPQDLPWTPLELDAPIGRATAGKLAGIDGPACRLLLDKADISYRVVPRTRDDQCGYGDGVIWTEGGQRRIRYLPTNPPLACPLAAGLVLWEREVVQPAAKRRLGVRA